MKKPFLPTDAIRVDPLLTWRRYATSLGVAAVRDEPFSEVALKFWGAEEMGRVVRAASAPASTTGWGAQLAATSIAVYLRSLRGRSAAARLFELAEKVDLSGVGVANVPGIPTGFAGPPFIGEGSPIPVAQGAINAVSIGPARKLAFISVLTAELAAYRAEAAESLIRMGIDDAAALALDVALFSDDAATSLHPAGLLHGLTPIPATSGGGIPAMMADIVNLIGAVADAGAGASIVFIAHPSQAGALKFAAGAAFDYEILPSSGLAKGTVIAIDPNAIVSAFGGMPELSVAKDTVIHMEGASPAPIGTPGSPNVVAAPIINGFQQDVVGLRLILRCAWESRLAGAVQVVTETNW